MPVGWERGQSWTIEALKNHIDSLFDAHEKLDDSRFASLREAAAVLSLQAREYRAAANEFCIYFRLHERMRREEHVLSADPTIGPSRGIRSWIVRIFLQSRKNGIAAAGACWVLIATVVRAANGEVPIGPSATQDWVQVVKDVGFPITVSSVCLYVIVSTLKEFTKSLYEFAKALNAVEKATETNTRSLNELRVSLLSGREYGKERP